MAEWVLPTPPPPPPPEPAAPVSTAFGSPLDPIIERSATAGSAAGHDHDNPVPPPPARPHETYIVQVPKDQIYRVPPPENAYLAERYRSERAAGKRRAPQCVSCLGRTLGVALAVAVLLVVGIVVLFVVLRPSAPSFTVDKLSVKNSFGHGQPEYDLMLTADNPSAVTGLSYESGGKAKLVSQGVTVANGNMPGSDEGSQKATEFKLALHGVRGSTPKAVEKGLKGSKEALVLGLSVEFAAQVTVGAIRFGRKSLSVDCEINVAGLRKDARIASQKCTSSF